MLRKFLFWRVKHISNQHFTILLSGVVGILAGVSAVLLKETVHALQHLLQGSHTELYETPYYILYPIIGILLTVIISRYIMKERVGHGISDILFNISQKSAVMARGKTWSRMMLSAITVGFGGSVGLEAPIVVTGSAIGSNLASMMHLDYNRRSLMIGCGSAAAIAAIFNSPIAGVIFAIEVILSDISVSAFIPLLIASSVGTLTSLALGSHEIMFSFKHIDAFSASDAVWFIGLGAFCALISVYFTRVSYFVEPRLHNIKHYALRALAGGLALAFIIVLFPSIYGEGYETIKALLNGQGHEVFHFAGFFFHNSGQGPYILIAMLAGILLLKPFATSLTIGSGGCGGIFAPSLFLGGIAGFLFATVINLIAGYTLCSPINFSLVGMAGVMSGVLHAPLMGIFLIAEITGGYALMVPLMIVSAMSFFVSMLFEKHSIYTKKLIERGQIFQDDRDGQVLNSLNISKLIETDLLKVLPTATIEEMIPLIKESKRNIFPVVNEEGHLRGIVTLDDIRELMFDETKRKEVVIKTIMHKPHAEVDPTEHMRNVMTKFQRTGDWNLPVIDKENDNQYLGFVSKARIFNAYRTKLQRQQHKV